MTTILKLAVKCQVSSDFSYCVTECQWQLSVYSDCTSSQSQIS